MYGLILAGGSGTRFWPRSRERDPKQLLQIVGSTTLIQGTLERLLPLIPVKKNYVVTNEAHAFETCRQLESYGFSPNQLLAEPVGRNTAAAIAYSARFLADFGEDEVMAVFPADHVIQNPADFLKLLERAEAAAREGFLVTLGIQPTRPETGYGYIKKAQPLNGFDGLYHVQRFVEKPNREVAEQYISEKDYFWNCGVFVWKISTILEEIKTYMPELYAQLDNIKKHTKIYPGKYGYHVVDKKGKELYGNLPATSIDYGIMEQSQKVAILPTDVDWNDVGSWTALADVEKTDAQGNVLKGDVISLSNRKSIIHGSEERLVAAIGLDNVIVVDTPDALLVCHKDMAQDVKKVVEKIKEDKKPQAEIHTTVKKPWGSYTVLTDQKNFLVKTLTVFPGESLSMQSHNHRSEHWTVVAGEAEVVIDGNTQRLKKDKSTYIPVKSKHQLSNPGDEPLVITEIQVGDIIDENDIIRYEDRYGRSDEKTK